MPRPYINAIIALSMTCSITYADASWDAETSSYKALVLATSPVTKAVEIELDTNFAKTMPYTMQIPSSENIADLLKTTINMVWTTAASFEAESLSYHLRNLGLANNYACSLATTLIQTPMRDSTLTDWATKVALKLTLNSGLLPNGIKTENFTLSTTVQYLIKADALTSLALAGVAFYNPLAATLLADEISAIAAATPDYVSWLVADEQEATKTQTFSTIASSSSTEDEQPKASTKGLWSKATKGTQKVWDKFTHSVKVGTQRAYEALTWENTKTFVTAKTKKLLGISFKK